MRRTALVTVLFVALAVLGASLAGRAQSADSTIREFATAQGGQPFLISRGPDARLWYSTGDTRVEAMTTAGAPTSYDVPDTAGGTGGIALSPGNTVAVGQSGFGNFPNGALSSVAGDGSAAHGPLSAQAAPNQLATGPDGNVWYAGDRYACRATPALDAQNCATLSNSAVGADGIATGSDGNLWVTERVAGAIVRVTPGLGHQEFPLSDTGSAPYGITAGPDGALWFTEISGNRIGRITTSGDIREFTLPHAASDPMGITQGPDGALWFAESAGNRIGRITTSGQITEFTIPTANAGARGIVTGPDGALWFTEETAGKIGRLVPPAAAARNPIARIAASSTTPSIGRLAAFNPTASVAGTGALTRFAYDFDGSGRFQATCPASEPVAYKVFDSPGSRLVGVRVTDAAGRTATTHLAIDAVRKKGVRTTKADARFGAINHFWCGDASAISKVGSVYLPKLFTSDVRAVGVDVTQGVVPDPPRPAGLVSVLNSAATRFGAHAAGGSSASYLLNNDRQDPRTHRISWLQRYGTTVVRVYASSIVAPNGSSVPDVQMKLYGFRDGHPLPGSPLLSQTGPLTVPVGPPFTTHAMRIGYSPVDGALPAFTFTLPKEWVNAAGNVAMAAVPQLVGSRLDSQCDTLECKLGQQAGSGDFQFSNTGLLIVRTVAMTAKGDPPLPDPGGVFDAAANVTPTAVLASPYQATVDITPITTCKAGDKTQQCTNPNGWVTGQIGLWLANNPPTVADSFKTTTIGVHKNHGSAQGYSGWPVDPGCTPNPPGALCETSTNSPVSQVEVNRPLTSVGHELQHDLGRPHADDSTSGCGGNGAGKPDSKGQMLSIGLDRHANSGGSPAQPYKVLAPGLPGEPASQYDLMSYCASTAEGDSWTSSYTWDVIASDWIFYLRRLAESRLAQLRTAPGSVQVSGLVEPGSTTITQVDPTGAGAAHASAVPQRSAVHARTLTAGGKVVADVPLNVTQGHLDHTGANGKNDETPTLAFNGFVPAASAARLQVVTLGKVAATRTRSAHAPKVRLLAPRRGTIGRRSKVTVRWRSSDADGDRLLTTVAYSADAGRHWRTVYVANGDARQVRLSSRYFTGARNARIRVRVNDGFNAAASTSGRLRAVGSKPAVHIRSPRRGQRFFSDAAVPLAGSAFDDTFRDLSGSRLVWYAGRRRLGTGGLTAARDLQPGRVRLRLVARDRHGRRGSASVRIRVLAARPFFVTLTAPRRISRRARSIRLRVATNVTATLKAGGRRYRVTRHGRSVRVKVKRARRTLTLSLRLVAHGRSATRTLHLPRR